MTSKQLEKYLLKKERLKSEIYIIREERSQLNSRINSYYNGTNKKENVAELTYSIFKLNKELNIKRDAIDEINRKLYSHKKSIIYGSDSNTTDIYNYT